MSDHDHTETTEEDRAEFRTALEIYRADREPSNGESYGPNGIRPVPPHVPHYPEEADAE